MIPVVAFCALAVLTAACVENVRRIRYFRREDTAQRARASAMQPSLDAALAERRARPERPAQPPLVSRSVPVVDLSRTA